MPEAVEGWVVVGDRYKHALKIRSGRDKGKIARYPAGGGDGVWCGPKVAKTFIESPWTFSVERIEAIKRHQAELDRLMPARRSGYWGEPAFDCLVCGAIVSNREKHLKWHKADVFFETLVSLFGRPY